MKTRALVLVITIASIAGMILGGMSDGGGLYH